MSEYRFQSIADEYQNKIEGNAYHFSGETGDDGENFSEKEKRLWIRVLFCAGLIFLAVFAKIWMPDGFETLRTTVQSEWGEAIDYRAVFGAIGKAVSGENSLEESLGEVYLEVFHPLEEKKAVETSAVIQIDENSVLADGVCLADGEGGLPPVAPESTVQKEQDSFEIIQKNTEEFQCTAPVFGRISSTFGYRDHPVTGERKLHRGMDIAAPEGREILCFSDGTVKAVGESKILGNYIMVQHNTELTTLYAHCSRIMAESGQKVKMGEKIAEVGQTGRATGPHLHFGVLKNGEYVDPGLYVDPQKKE